MKIKLAAAAGVEVGHEQHISKTLKAINERKKACEDLKIRSDELKTRAAMCRRSDPVKARLLDHRSIVLSNEVYRMKKENEKPMTYDEIRRSALLGECALIVDKGKFDA